MLTPAQQTMLLSLTPGIWHKLNANYNARTVINLRGRGLIQVRKEWVTVDGKRKTRQWACLTYAGSLTRLQILQRVATQINR